MKKSLVLLVLCIATQSAQTLRAQINDPGQVAQQGATNHANNDISRISARTIPATGIISTASGIMRP